MSDIPYRIIRSDRKTASIEVDRTLNVTVRAPLFMPEAEIDRFVKSSAAWIEKAKGKQMNRARNAPPEPDEQRTAELKQKAKEILPPKIRYFSGLTGLYPTSVKVTGAKTRFGSCSSKNAVCFSYRLMQYPDSAIDYVVLHELCHIKHHDHSRRFWALIERYMPDCKSRRELLK